MRKLRHIILLSLCVLSIVPAWSQRRYSIAEQWEYSLAELSGFSSKDVNNSTDVLFGLHASQYTGSHHLIGFSIDGGWSAFTTTMPRVSCRPGGGTIGARFLYEYQYSGILFQLGAGFAYQRVFNDLADTVFYHPNMRDTWSSVNNREFTLKHAFYDRRDMAQQLYVSVPVYIGHYIPGPKGIGYILAGFNCNYALWGNTEQHLTGTTTGLYEYYVGIWREMDNHGFRKDVPIERTGGKLNLKFDLQAHLEGGYEYTSQQNPHSYRVLPMDRMDIRLRVAAFIDYGILNISPEGRNVLYGLPMETIYDFPTYRMDHVFSTADARPYWLRNLNVGIRFTVLFGFQGKERCILCDPWRH